LHYILEQFRSHAATCKLSVVEKVAERVAGRVEKGVEAPLVNEAAQECLVQDTKAEKRVASSAPAPTVVDGVTQTTLFVKLRKRGKSGAVGLSLRAATDVSPATDQCGESEEMD
jgi:hypothetical protein